MFLYRCAMTGIWVCVKTYEYWLWLWEEDDVHST
jgi:hypothetical protein